MKIYRILGNYYFGGEFEYPDEEDGIPLGFTRTAPPEQPETEETVYTRWNGVGWEHTSDPPPPEPVPPKFVSKLTFLDRLGDDEYVAILTASKTDVEIEAWINKFNLLSEIDLNDAKTAGWLTKFVSKNLITQEKADKVLNDPI
jgi:hypothetical protein